MNLARLCVVCTLEALRGASGAAISDASNDVFIVGIFIDALGLFELLLSGLRPTLLVDDSTDSGCVRWTLKFSRRK